MKSLFFLSVIAVLGIAQIQPWLFGRKYKVTLTTTTTTAASGSSVPNNPVTWVNRFKSQRFSFSPSDYCKLDSIYVDGVKNTDSSTGYTFKRVTGNHTLALYYSGRSYTHHFFVDSAGSDSKSGKNVDSAWKTLGKVNSASLVAGDTVSFRKNCGWTGTTLTINANGAAGNYIVFNTYGTGTKPKISIPAGTKFDSDIELAHSYGVIDGFWLDTCGYAGVRLDAGANNNIIQNCEITKTGQGLELLGAYTTVTSNYIHHLHMITLTASPSNDDYGAVGVWIYTSGNTISYNTLDSCYATSFDYGEDGGGIEFTTNPNSVDSNKVHHNWVQDCNGFMEWTASGAFMERRDSIYYNVYINKRGVQAINFHNAGLGSMKRDYFDNNTLYLQCDTVTNEAFAWTNNTLSDTSLFFRNNIVFLNNWKWVKNSSAGMYQSSYNVYWTTVDTSSMGSGFTLGTGDKKANPLFVSAAINDLRLLSTSPAKDAGTNLSYTLDFLNYTVPYNSTADCGAYEYHP